MQIKSNWRELILKAHSIRWMVLAFILTALEVGLPLWAPAWMPPGVFASLSGLATGGAFLARLYAQKNLPGEP